MKIIRKGKQSVEVKSIDNHQDNDLPARHVWKVLIVDDEPDVHQITKLNLRGFSFEERSLIFLQAYTAEQAKLILNEETDIAVALIDVVMESDDAGLKLVEYIRKDIKNEMVRLIIRTGQPGQAPERFVIDNYDIDDYKDKTELTTQKLYTTVRSALKSYRDLLSLDMNRKGLLHILNATPEIYSSGQKSLTMFFQGMLTQIVSLYNLDANAIISTLDGVVATIDGKEVHIRAGTGEFENKNEKDDRVKEVINICTDAVISEKKPTNIRENSIIVPLNFEQKPIGFVYLEPTNRLTESDYHLILLFANQCSAALESLQLHFNLEKAYNHAIDMLALIAEFRDSSTGDHINRIAMYTSIIAQELGFSEQEVGFYGQAARLHDVGKVGISDNILLKPSRLTDEEFEVIKTHTQVGFEILNQDEHFELARQVALYHHERWDGAGYPEQLKGNNIPLIARIVSIIDVFDALVSSRCYKNSWSVEDAISEIKRCSGTQFDPELVNLFLNLYEKGRFNNILSSML